MKTVILLILSSLFISSCQKSVDLGQIKQEIISTEASFQTMAHDKGIAEAFAHRSAAYKQERSASALALRQPCRKGNLER